MCFVFAGFSGAEGEFGETSSNRFVLLRLWLPPGEPGRYEEGSLFDGSPELLQEAIQRVRLDWPESQAEVMVQSMGWTLGDVGVEGVEPRGVAAAIVIDRGEGRVFIPTREP